MQRGKLKMFEQNITAANTENSIIFDALEEKCEKNNTIWGADYIVLADKVTKKEELKKTIEGMLLMRALGI